MSSSIIWSFRSNPRRTTCTAFVTLAQDATMPYRSIIVLLLSSPRRGIKIGRRSWSTWEGRAKCGVTASSPMRHRSTTYGVTNNCPHSKATRYTCRNMGSGKYRPPGKRRGSASEIPDRKDLPTLLTAAGMVRLCGRPENFGSPLIGLDVAPTNFGVAITDPMRRMVTPVTRVRRRDANNKKLDSAIVFSTLKEIITDTSACGLVVGWPLERSGQAEGQCVIVMQFLRQMRLEGKVDLPVTLRDERMSSGDARRMLYEQGLSHDQVSAAEDETAAAVILGDFLECVEARDGGLSSLPIGPSSRDR